MKTFSKNWNKSKLPKKQRKYRAKAPLHLKSKFLSAHLAKKLRDKYSTRALRIRVGDKVKILRGSFKGTEGKVELVNIKKSKVFVAKVTRKKIDGSTVNISLEPSNLIITELNLDDKERKQILERRSKTEEKK